MLTLISYKIVDNIMLTPYMVIRYEHQMAILKGETIYPLQYRVLQPAMGYVLQNIIYLIVQNTHKANLNAYRIIALCSFLLMYSCFYYFLKMFFSEITCMLGLLLLQIVIPLSINGEYGEGDFYTFLFYTIGLILMFKSKDYFLPLVFGIGILNRDQIIFLMVFYIAYLIFQKRLFTKKSYIIVSMCLIAYALGYFALRWKFGFKYDDHITKNVNNNITYVWKIFQLWAAEVFIFVILSLKSFRKSNQFFKLSFISLSVYILFFFFFGYFGELAKFLPAYLIFIPMSLEALTGEPANIKEPAQLQKELNFQI
ncbi:MAG: hypothetical protein ABI840_11780 [bacterium]